MREEIEATSLVGRRLPERESNRCERARVLLMVHAHVSTTGPDRRLNTRTGLLARALRRAGESLARS
jgi:hypothetical protein